MKIVESKLVTILSEGFYGLEIGTVLQSQSSDGQPIYAHVAEILRICTGYSLYCSFEYEKNE
ncbi:MAG: hypothetical protein ACUZ9M_09900 [Candidatus Scalindua sp.]